MAKSVNVKIGGTWKPVNSRWLKVSGIWKRCSIWVKISGVWKDTESLQNITVGDNLSSRIVYLDGVPPVGSSSATLEAFYNEITSDLGWPEDQNDGTIITTSSGRNIMTEWSIYNLSESVGVTPQDYQSTGSWKINYNYSPKVYSLSQYNTASMILASSFGIVTAINTDLHLYPYLKIYK